MTVLGERDYAQCAWCGLKWSECTCALLDAFPVVGCSFAQYIVTLLTEMCQWYGLRRLVEVLLHL